MKEKTFKCVQCGECIVPPTGEQKDAAPSRTGCVLFHDQGYLKKNDAPESAGKKSWIKRVRLMLGSK
jgi:hypothetical protein